MDEKKKRGDGSDCGQSVIVGRFCHKVGKENKQKPQQTYHKYYYEYGASKKWNYGTRKRQPHYRKYAKNRFSPIAQTFPCFHYSHLRSLSFFFVYSLFSGVKSRAQASLQRTKVQISEIEVALSTMEVQLLYSLREDQKTIRLQRQRGSYVESNCRLREWIHPTGCG